MKMRSRLHFTTFGRQTFRIQKVAGLYDLFRDGSKPSLMSKVKDSFTCEFRPRVCPIFSQAAAMSALCWPMLKPPPRRAPLKACYRCPVLVAWLPTCKNGESYERGSNCWTCQESQWMVDALGHSDVCLWNSGHQPASGLLDWNCHSACLANSVRGNFTSDLCLSFSQHWRIPLADPARSDL